MSEEKEKNFEEVLSTFPYFKKKISFEECEHDGCVKFCGRKDVMWCPVCGYYFTIRKSKHINDL